jgi:UDP-N-acetylmuramoylalanine--D-glutamate ligase
MANVLVVGAGKSGVESARLLAGRGDRVFITDIKNDEAIRAAINSLTGEGVVKIENVEIGGHTEKFVHKADLVVVSPGVPKNVLPVKLAEDKKIPIISELELAYTMCLAPIIAVTGTSGKTTVTTLIGRILKKAGFDAIVCGNIGNPFSGEIKRIDKNSIVVLEVSSFQLERIDKFKPNIAVILNISHNHLDRHSDMEEYITAKSRIFINQDFNDKLFFNSKDEILKRLLVSACKKTNVEFFDKYKDFNKRYNIQNEDFLAVMSIASEKGVSIDIMLDIIKNFKGIEHRMEYVDTLNDVQFINDSKATTISSIQWALKSVRNNVVLIMGGRYKGGDFGDLRQLVEEKVDLIISIGEAKPEIRKGLEGVKEILEAGTFRDAVLLAFKRAKKGGVVLLSPGCSSFDMFKSYEERGNVFKGIVREIRDL